MVFVHQISLKLVHKNIVCTCYYCAKKKNMKKIRRASGTRISGTGGAISYLVCKVLYMKILKYVDLIEIGTTVF